MKNNTLNHSLVLAWIMSLSLQVGMAAGFLLAWIPLAGGAMADILPDWQDSFRLKWDLTIYVLVTMAAVLLTVLTYQRRLGLLDDEQHGSRVRLRVTIEIALTLMLLASAFKMMIYDNSPMLAQRAFVLLGVLALLHKLFLDEFLSWAGSLKDKFLVCCPFLYKEQCWQWVSLIGIGILIYVPDLEKVLALSVIGEQVHHLDFFVMSAGLAAWWGKLPYAEVMSQYGLGLPLILPKLAAALGGRFDYIQVLGVVMWWVIVYFALSFILMRWYFKDIAWGLIGALWFFKLQMFHFGVSPLAWIYPSTTPIRYGADILWMMALYIFLLKGHRVLIYAAAVYSGFAVFLMSSSGLCLMLSFYAFIVIAVTVPAAREQIRLSFKETLLCLLLPLLSLAGCLLAAGGSKVFNPVFWKHLVEYMEFFGHGHPGGVLPMFESLKYRNSGYALMGFLLPVMYLGAVICLTILLAARKIASRHWISVIIGIYALLNYQYYIVRSAQSSFLVHSLPLVWMVGMLMASGVRRCALVQQRMIKAVVLLLSLYALMTTHNYISYPNMLNLSANPMVDITVAQRYPDRQGYFNHLVKPIKEEDKLPLNSLGDQVEDIRTEDDFKDDAALKAYVRGAFDFTPDAALIQALTRADEAVAVLSSFETRMLIQAKRKPYFYHIPIVSSQPMRMRTYPADAAHSPRFLEETLAQLTTDPPRVVFMQRVFLQDKLPASAQQGNAAIIALVEYIKTHYTAGQTGQYLVAMIRNQGAQ